MAKTEPYDAIIVGSGAGGGMAAYSLTKAGLKVLMLEAGRNYDPVTETPMFNIPAGAPLRGVSTPDKPFGFYDATVDGGWEVPNEPYTVAPGSEPFLWWRPRMLGGRTNHWGRISLRFGPLDFKPQSRDGLGYDWPITYDDMAPWYDKTERLIGVTGGGPMGLLNTPDSPEGCLQPPPAARAFELAYARAFKAMGIPVKPLNVSVLTQPLNGRSACIYSTPCGRGCSIKANFQSTTVLLPPAVATGKLDILTDALVYEVEIDKAGHAKGVSYVSRVTGEHHSVTARVVVLAAGACESARILLNSKSSRFPNGLCNDHGVVGRYLMDSVGASVSGHIPAMEGLPPTNDDDGMSTPHTYVPWWGYEKQLRKQMSFPRGYHIEIGGGRQMPSMGLGGLLSRDDELTTGDALRSQARRMYGSTLGFAGRGEMIPNEDCYTELDPVVKDKWGIPVLRFHWKWSEYETRQAGHMVETFLEVIDKLGGKPLRDYSTDGKKAISKGGEIIHEVGTVRMGTSEKDSVVNQWGQTWACKNLFVTDGAVLASSPDKNPTLSILALSWRSSDHLAEMARRGEL